jgi:hypothetical protein
MKQLTQEQIKILEAVFASYPKDYIPIGNYDSMEGINLQLKKINTEDTTEDNIFYISSVKKCKEDIIVHAFSIEKMKVEEMR